ncbi:MAG: hypothetical protein PUA93_06255 [Eubacteriales bacterium]|jgi:dUTP pyrophosphatase|nr:hypothetical protein [Eubacteriales bacterium]
MENNRIKGRFVLCTPEEVKSSFPAPKQVVLPKRSSAYSAGYDFTCPYSVDIKPGEEVIIPTYVKCLDCPHDKVLKIYVRSSLGIKRNLMLANGTGVIDSDYVWCIYVALVNYGKEVAHIDEGERFVQGIFEDYYVLEDEEEVTASRTGGIGSSGKK